MFRTKRETSCWNLAKASSFRCSVTEFDIITCVSSTFVVFTGGSESKTNPKVCLCVLVCVCAHACIGACIYNHVNVCVGVYTGPCFSLWSLPTCLQFLCKFCCSKLQLSAVTHPSQTGTSFTLFVWMNTIFSEAYKYLWASFSKSLWLLQGYWQRLPENCISILPSGLFCQCRGNTNVWPEALGIH